MDIKAIFNEPRINAFLDFVSILAAGLVLTTTFQQYWNSNDTNHLLQDLPGALLSILAGFLGGYFIKIFLPRRAWWDAVPLVGLVACGCVSFIVPFDRASNLVCCISSSFFTSGT